MYDKTLWRNGEGGYTSRSGGGLSPSSVYTTVTTARKLLQGGVEVELPEGWSQDDLDRIAWIAGTVGEDVKLTARQAREVARLANTILENHGESVDRFTVEVINEVVRVVRD